MGQTVENSEGVCGKNANEIISGDISVNPVDGSVDACKYCDYSEICKFQGEHFKAERMESTQVFEKMLEAVENGGVNKNGFY